MTSPALQLLHLCTVLGGYGYSFDHELELQDGIEQALGTGQLAFEREVRLAPRDIIDFFLAESGIGIEVKIGGTLSAVTRQLHRYARHERVQGLLLVSSLARLTNIPTTLNGKPVAALALRGGLR